MMKKKIKRIVIKIGTRVLTDDENRIDKSRIRDLTRQMADLMDRGIEVVVVTSGAIGAGLGLLMLDKKNKSLSELQAIASIGQNHLMDIYSDCFGKRDYMTGQILLTQEDLNDRRRFLNIRYTLSTLLKYKAVPVINENDSVSTEEIKCGDNDRLSSLVADLANADMLMILTDVEGLYDNEGNVLRNVGQITRSIKAFCKDKKCAVSTGGMVTKLESLKNAADSGISGVIANGRKKRVILDVVDGKDVGTRFEPQEVSLKAKKRWIAFSVKAKGSVFVDEGAAGALVNKNRSLLPSGIKSVIGNFSIGDIVEIVVVGKKTIARGLSNYSSDEIEKIKGKRTDGIEKVLGYKDYDEVIHRDNLVILKSE